MLSPLGETDTQEVDAALGMVAVAIAGTQVTINFIRNLPASAGVTFLISPIFFSSLVALSAATALHRALSTCYNVIDRSFGEFHMKYFGGKV